MLVPGRQRWLRGETPGTRGRAAQDAVWPVKRSHVQSLCGIPRCSTVPGKVVPQSIVVNCRRALEYAPHMLVAPSMQITALPWSHIRNWPVRDLLCEVRPDCVWSHAAHHGVGEHLLSQDHRRGQKCSGNCCTCHLHKGSTWINMA